MGNEDWRARYFREIERGQMMQQRVVDTERELDFVRDDNTLLKA